MADDGLHNLDKVSKSIAVLLTIRRYLRTHVAPKETQRADMSHHCDPIPIVARENELEQNNI